ncbi:MAG: hypothetical protein VB070_09320 [Clostridiaceae bacterium]|nr:hypothetical protein [Clostridiaceae bacterium]
MASKITVNTNEIIGPVKPLNGIDNGPVCFGELIDSTEFYKQAGFPYVRLHDTNYPHPREVDIPQIFPDFNADADNPASYNFIHTDAYLQQCLNTGASIIYRLGVSIEHPKIKYTVNPPQDFEKWSDICLHIIRHVNEGWADGHQWNIRFWEIWNEPDLLNEDRSTDAMWSGTPDQYFQLYAITSRKLKKAFPELMIGGYAAAFASEKRKVFFQNFLDFVKKEQLPLDFFSWHRYADDPEAVAIEAGIAQDGLDHIGYKNTLSICDEWNYTPWRMAPERYPMTAGSQSAFVRGGLGYSATYAGASYDAAVIIRLQDTSTAVATHYTGDPTNYYCTIFDRYGYPEKPYYSFVAFNEIIARRNRCRIDLEGCEEGLYVCAAADHTGAALLATPFNHGDKTYKIDFKGLDSSQIYHVKKYLIDQYHCYDLIEDQKGYLADLTIDTYLNTKATLLITLLNL